MKGSKGNLVLTGWYYPEYLAAAAAAYGGHYKGNAEVLGVSKFLAKAQREGLV